ncbi:flippase-like domain-containing protein [Sedimentibacter sp. zth1]|uniref:lysylphosphatidylglycerol synthase transmembrane domain-containing protein n=1 Tax=Sedimentibacter sp. zth1 TaxID=2816908 RepID=UPI001A923084|nr:lysylphosphatidylglycerol synthase transmembrane domain-containing protein [Sedimentibacter sp. zth1]QSX05869.1 flippase-like domain-containing protein [Sedimentibacter sp. zth1]
MKDKMSNKKIFVNIIFFMCLVFATFFLLFRNSDIKNIFDSLKNVNRIYIFIASLCMLIFMSSEALNIKMLSSIFNYKLSFLKCLKYSFIGFFFSSITPSASGGQPMQIYYMKKDKIDIPHSTLILLIVLAVYQLVSIVLSLILFCIQPNLFLHISNNFKLILIFGCSLNIIVLVFITFALFSKNIIKAIINFVVKILTKFKIKNIDNIEISMIEGVEKYQQGAIYIKKNKKLILRIMLVTIVQICAMNIVPYFIYKSFSLSGYSILSVLSLQTVLQMCISSIPLPGSVGVSESGFLKLFSLLYPVYLIDTAMLLSRGVSFYLYLIITGVVVFIIQTKTLRNLKIKNKVS